MTREVTLTSGAQLVFQDLGLSGNTAIGATLFNVSVAQDVSVTAAVTDDPSKTLLSADGMFSFFDVDRSDTHYVTFEPRRMGRCTGRLPRRSQRIRSARAEPAR